jgi:hypothetical protein
LAIFIHAVPPCRTEDQSGDFSVMDTGMLPKADHPLRSGKIWLNALRKYRTCSDIVHSFIFTASCMVQLSCASEIGYLQSSSIEHFPVSFPKPNVGVGPKLRSGSVLLLLFQDSIAWRPTNAFYRKLRRIGMRSLVMARYLAI